MLCHCRLCGTWGLYRQCVPYIHYKLCCVKNLKFIKSCGCLRKWGSVTFLGNSTNLVVLVCHCNYSYTVVPQLWRSTCRRPLEMCWRSSTASSWNWEEMLRWRERERWGPTGFWERSRRAIEIVKMREKHSTGSAET